MLKYLNAFCGVSFLLVACGSQNNSLADQELPVASAMPEVSTEASEPSVSSFTTSSDSSLTTVRAETSVAQTSTSKPKESSTTTQNVSAEIEEVSSAASDLPSPTDEVPEEIWSWHQFWPLERDIRKDLEGLEKNPEDWEQYAFRWGFWQLDQNSWKLVYDTGIECTTNQISFGLAGFDDETMMMKLYLQERKTGELFELVTKFRHGQTASSKTVPEGSISVGYLRKNCG